MLGIVNITSVLSGLTSVVHFAWKLPEVLRTGNDFPIQFGFDGTPNFWLTPSLGFAIFPALALGTPYFLQRKYRSPSGFNYPWTVTPDDLPRARAHTRTLLLGLQFTLAVFMPIIQYYSVPIALGDATALPSALVPSLLSFMAALYVSYFAVMVQPTEADEYDDE